ncbi:MAG TPA: undecaprenyldiphospho-muramoylpentapeptide beta-N-acetylglucosaminyltransferase, partial [Clostridia bacterium]|nr:undecaprenyldiphospho-muramoylpentapeptide beta-N-acetylglucosaminyltransferase [Clostridia bacterium]
MNKKRIVLTGGGTGGHVMPNIALMEKLKKDNWEIHYIGTKKGVEYSILAHDKDLKYYSINAGKLRRYVDIQNLVDPIRIISGYFGAIKILMRVKPAVVFSKGGFVTVPVIAAARMLGIPTVIHESDITPGLANKLCIPFANKICATFPETLNHLPKSKSVLTGTPIRQSLLAGDRAAARRKYLLKKPTILIMGGSQGAKVINENVRQCLPRLLKHFDVIHICGNNNLSDIKYDGYIQFEFVSDELKDIFAASDIVISRAGANSIFEFLALKKPMLLIPLSRAQSRGDQCDNAESFKKHGFAAVLEQENLTPGSLYAAV